MMERFAYAILLVSILLLSGSVSLAQDKEPLKVKWLAKDVKAFQLLPRLMPIENQTTESLKNILGENTGIDKEDLGFGAQRVSLTKGNGYTQFYIDAFIFNGSFGYYEIGVRGSSDSWSLIRETIIQAWKQNGDVEYAEGKYGLTHRKTFDYVFQSYKSAISAELGEMKPVDVPANLKEAYEYLISPMENSYVGKGVCGYGGSVLEGRIAIDALVDAKRIDLIENVLRGYNPGGRIYAALALLEMNKQGVKLNKDVLDVISKVSNLGIKITTCSGCIVNHSTAKEILRLPETY